MRFSVAQLEQLNTGISRVKGLNPTGATRALTEKKKRISHDSLMNSSPPTSPKQHPFQPVKLFMVQSIDV